MNKMTTVYLTEKQIKWFKEHPEISRSEVIRQALDNYIRVRK